MKALMIKDLRLLLRQQRATIFLFLAIVLMIIVATDNPIFGILYTVFLLPSLLISTISYDTFENGMPFLMAMPISQKEYVAEKYLLAVGGSVIVNILATGFTYLIQALKGTATGSSELLIGALTAQIVILLYSAIVLPINLYYGTEKGRIVIVIMAVSIGALLSGTGKILEMQETGTAAFLTGIYQFGVVELLLIGVVICAVLDIVSYFVCVKWIKKKEY